MSDVAHRIKQELNANQVVIFMKGTPDSPQCGFSARAVQILQSIGRPFHAVDILAHPEIRSALPLISNWPTFPQIFVKGKLVGGCDIVSEMQDRGELKPMIEEAFKEGGH